MFIDRKPHLRTIQRMRVAEGRNLEKGLRLDRNEKVDAWPMGFLAQIMASKPDYFLSVYPESGSLYLKLAKHLGVRVEELLLTSGIDGGIKSLFEIMTDPGDTVGVLSPTYAMYRVYSGLFQTKLTEIGYRPDLSLNRTELEACISQRPVMLFLPNPNQPIESEFSLPELRNLASRCRKNNVLLVVDEAYHMFGAESALPLVQEFDNVVVLRTFSKGFGVPSIRLGCLVSSEENMQVLSKTRFAHESNGLSNAVAEYLLDHYHHVTNYIAKVLAGRKFVTGALQKLGLGVHGRVGNFLLIDMQTPDAAAKTAIFLKERFIYVKGPWPTPWDRYLTITLGPTPLMRRFVQAMKEAKGAVI